MSHINLVKICVGADTIEDLAQWQARPVAQDGHGAPRHVTRMWPRRGDALLAGGSLFWVIRGAILVRQRILRLDEVTGSDGILRCGLALDARLIRTQAAPRRPFQGWRYLSPEDAPADLPSGAPQDAALPADLALALAEIGVR